MINVYTQNGWQCIEKTDMFDMYIADKIVNHQLESNYDICSALIGPNTDLIEFFLLDRKLIFDCKIWLIAKHSLNNMRIIAYGFGDKLNMVSRNDLEKLFYDALKNNKIFMSIAAIDKLKTVNYSLFI